jgi:hypothetical protein
MTNEERDKHLMEMHADIREIKGLVIRHDHSLYGNGRPGLCQRMDQVEIQQRDCPARANMSAGMRSNRIAVVGVIMSVIMSVAAIVMGAFKP